MKIMKKTSVDKFLHGSNASVDKFLHGSSTYGSNMSDSEKIKMWQDQHAFQIKNTLGITPNELQSKMDNDARNKVMKTVKVQLKYIVKDRDKLKKVNEDLEKPDLTEEKKVELKKQKDNCEDHKLDVCGEAEKYLYDHINKKYGSSNVKIHTDDNIKYFEMVKGWFMNPPQGRCVDLKLIGDDYPPKWMEDIFDEY